RSPSSAKRRRGILPEGSPRGLPLTFKGGGALAATTAAPRRSAPGESLKESDLLSLNEFTGPEIRTILDRAHELKRIQRRREPHRWLDGHSLAMILEKPSRR